MVREGRGGGSARARAREGEGRGAGARRSRATRLGRVGRLGRRRLLVGSRPTPLRGPALGEPRADPLAFRLPLPAAAAVARGGVVAIAAAALARPRRGAATPPRAVARWRKLRRRRRSRCYEALSLFAGGSCQREGRGASRTAPAPSTTLPAPAVGSRGGGGGAVGRHTALPDGDDPPVPAGAFREACHDAHGRCAQPRLREHLSYRGAARARESRRCVREGGVGGSRTASADDEGVPVPTDGHADAACRGAHEGDAQTPLKPHLAPAQGGMGGAANRRSAGSWRGAWL